MDTTNIIEFARANLSPLDSFAVTVVAMQGPMSSRAIGEMCNRSTSWFCLRRDRINETMAKAGVVVEATGHGYQIFPLSKQDDSECAPVLDQAREPEGLGDWVEPVSDPAVASEAPAKPRSHFFRSGPAGVDLFRMIGVSPDLRRGCVVASLNGGSYVTFWTKDPNGLAAELLDAKAECPGTIVTEAEAR